MTQRRLEHWVAFYHRWVKDAGKRLAAEQAAQLSERADG